MTHNEALMLLRSGQMSESRYIQLSYENGWDQFALGAYLLAEAGNALNDKDAEIERLRVERDDWKQNAEWQQTERRKAEATIADLTAALRKVAQLQIPWQEMPDMARAALAKAGGKE